MQKLERKSEKAHERLDAAREKLPTHKVLKKERVFDEETGKGKTRLHFEDELEKPKGKGKLQFEADKTVRKVGDTLASGIHGKIHEVEQENSAVEAAHKTEIAAETAARHFRHHRESSVNKPYEKVSKLEHKADAADAKLQYERNQQEHPEMKKQNMYATYMSVLGNREDLFGDSPYVDKYITNPPADYDVNPEYLNDEKFAALITEAEKYLGYPYVWGGSNPDTSFDCSGFVSYVLTNSGLVNTGRLGAQGLYNVCAPVSKANAQPGDLIFFVGTYDTPGVSHVGIYVGDGVMIHCGDPIQYTSINSSYWQQHFYAFGRPAYCFVVLRSSGGAGRCQLLR